MDTLVSIAKTHDAYITSLIATFQEHLEGILATAQVRLQVFLRENLTLDKSGRILRNIKNGKVLRKLDQYFQFELERAGYTHLLNEFVNQFPGQLEFFQRTLEVINAGLKTPLPAITFSPTDLRVFQDFGISQKDLLQNAITSVVTEAQNRILMSYGGLPFGDLVVSLSQYLRRSIPESLGLAETATATFYRLINERGYEYIQADLPALVNRYRYYGPDDKLTRPFCHRMMSASKDGASYTRAEIDKMDNGQIPNVFETCGGFRCRHWWVLDTDATLDGRTNG